MRYKTCIYCGKEFRCKLAEKCHYWLELNCECDECTPTRVKDCEVVDSPEKIIFT